MCRGRILEDGKELEPVFGAGLTGLINMGNTCYMNSIMQLLLSVKPFEDAYGSSDEYVSKHWNVISANLCISQVDFIKCITNNRPPLPAYKGFPTSHVSFLTMISIVPASISLVCTPTHSCQIQQIRTKPAHMCFGVQVVRAMMSGNHSAPLPEAGEPDEVSLLEDADGCHDHNV